MLKVIRIAVLVCATLTVGSTVARANSIGPDCLSCFGATYSLDILAAPDLNYASDHTFDTYKVVLSIDTAGYVADPTNKGVRIDEVAVKISNTVDTAMLTSAPGGLSVWEPIKNNTGLSGNGCSGGGNGFECADWIVGSADGAKVNGTVLTWEFLIDVGVNGPFSFTSLDPNAVPSIKVRYVDATDKQVGLVSEKVPEPATLALLGVGMSLAAIRRRRV